MVELADTVAAEIGSRREYNHASGTTWGAGSISEPEQKADRRRRSKPASRCIGAGLLDDAERLYAGILKLVPEHFDAMHLLGVVHQQRGDSDEALQLIGAALELNAASADAFANHGKVLLQLRRYDEALVEFRARARVGAGPSAGADQSRDHPNRSAALCRRNARRAARA